MANSIELAIRIAGRVDRTLQNAVRQTQSQFETLSKAAKFVSVGVAAGVTAIGGAAIVAGKQMIDLGHQWQTATNQMAAATGAAGDELADLRDIMEDIYANNFGESVEDVAEALAQVKTNMRDMPTDALQTATESAIALRDALGYDVESTTRAAEAMRKNFGTAAADAFGLIAAGAQNGLDYSGELLDTISEYSVQFSKLGFDADGMFQVLQSGTNSTAWNLDKVGDAIKEFSIRAIDGSNTTITAFEALGYNAQETMAAIASGGEVANDAFFGILNRLLSVEDAVERDALGVSLFGTMWEDLGVEAMTALAQASDAAYDTGNALEQINSVKYNDLGSVLEGMRRKLEIALLPAAESLYTSLLDAMPQIGDALDEIAPVLGELAGSFATDMISFLVNNLPYIVQLIRDTADAASEMYQQLKPVISALWDKLQPVVENAKEILTNLVDFLHNIFSENWDGAVENLGNILKNLWDGIGTLLTGLLKGAFHVISNLWPKIAEKIQNGIGSILQNSPIFGAWLQGLWDSLQPFFDNIKNIFSNIIGFLENVFAGNWKGALENLVNIFRNLWGGMANLIMAPLRAALSAVSEIWSQLTAVIENGIAAVAQKFPALGTVLNSLWQSIKAIVENIKQIFSGILDFISNVFSGNWSAAWQNIVDIFSNIFGMIGNLVKAPINAVISVINYAIEKINGISVTIPDWVPGIGGGTYGFNIPTIPQLAAGGIATRATLAEIGEGGEPEAVLPLSKLSQLLKQVTGLDLNGGSGGNPGGGEPQVIQFAPVFNFYGPVSREQAEEASSVSFAEFMKLYKRMQAEERRKKFAPA